MIKLISETILISLLSTSISAQIDQKSIAEKVNGSGLNSIQPTNLNAVTVLEDQVDEILSRKHGIVLNCKCRHKREVPVVLLNGEINDDGLNYIDPKEIKSITILRDQSSTDNKTEVKGIILIKTKRATKRIYRREPLVVINGIASRKGVESINPKTVKTITVLQDQASKDSYGKAAENGVIVVTTAE